MIKQKSMKLVSSVQSNANNSRGILQRRSEKENKPLFFRAGSITPLKISKTPLFAQDFTKIPIQNRVLPIQSKQFISQPDDPLEREADRVADHVMRMSSSNDYEQSTISNKTGHSIQRQAKTDAVGDVTTEQVDEESGESVARFVALGRSGQSNSEEEMPETIQRKQTNSQPQVESTPLLLNSSTSTSDGKHLGSNVKSDMEQRFGTDFSNVQVHSGSRSDLLCKSVAARAFTYGNHIHFASNEYQPSSETGQRLLAHELTHTIQQGATANKSLSNPNSIHGLRTVQPRIQRAIDLSIQFDTYSLSALRGAVPVTGGAASVLRSMENTAYSSFGARNPVTSMSVTDKWYYYNPMFTRSLYATRSWSAVNLLIPNNGYWWANDVHRFSFNYRHMVTRPRTGSFAVASGASRSRTTTISGGAKLTYSVLELSATASSAATTGSTASTTATTTNFYEHDYQVSLSYNTSYYNQSDFAVRTTFWGPEIIQTGGPHTSSGTINIGTCSVKDDDSNPDNLTP